MRRLSIADFLREAVLPGNKPEDRDSMSPSSGDATQNPEPKSSSGLASVFKSLTGSKSSRSPLVSPLGPSTQRSNGTPSNPTRGGPPDLEHFQQQLKRGNSISDRVCAAEALKHAVQDYPLDGVISTFRSGQDLIEYDKPIEARIAGFELLTACVKHEASTDTERYEYFQVLTADANPEDFHLQLAAMVELARHGKDLSGFHYDAIPLLTNWLRTIFASTTMARKNAGRQHRTQKSKGPIEEETNLSHLFAFIVDVIKFSFNVSSEETTGDLIDVMLYICVNTPLSSDLRACISVLDAIVTYAVIPGDKLLDCVKVLCSIHCLVNEVQPEAWRSISNLCRSHNGQITVRILLDILRNTTADATTGKQAIREIRGALSVLEKLFAKDGTNGYPLVPFTLLIEALTKVVAVEHTIKVENDVLRLVLSLFHDEDSGSREIKNNVMEEDWSMMFEAVAKCSQKALEADSRIARPRLASPLVKEESQEQSLTSSLGQTLYSLIIRIEELLNKFSDVDFSQREDCIKFFLAVHSHLPESCAKKVIDHFVEYRYCYPSDQQWSHNIKELLEAFFADRSQPTHIRLHALKAATDVFSVFEMMNVQDDPKAVQTFVETILEGVGDEKDISVLQEVLSFAVQVAENADESLFKYVIDAIRSTITGDRLQSPLGSPPSSRQGFMSISRSNSSSILPSVMTHTPSNVVTKGLIHIFMRTMDKSPLKPMRIFEEILWVAKSVDCETDARISAMKMLFRLRADWANGIFLTSFTESDGLAASLYRTPASLARKQAADEAAQAQRLSRSEEGSTPRMSRSTSFSQGHLQGRQPIRTVSGVNRTLLRNHQMWMTPDPDALPEPASGRASLVLTSVLDKFSADKVPPEAAGKEPEISEEVISTGDTEFNSDSLLTRTVEASQKLRHSLNIPLYLDTIINLMQNGCDWEVYSYILVHLPAQLTNQALFKAAIPQIKSLRTLLCEQIKSGSFQEPPVSSGLRKVDVAICLFQILIMVMSYHKLFSKPDQDEIVQTFIRGVGERTSKSCIHAISLCCHELPGSTSKALVTILQKMSQIITQSHVAVHILEFLACLARLPGLYVNFREDEYRIVFAICFRYLQYVRDQQAKETPSRSNTPAPRNSMVSVDGSRIVSDAGESNFQPNTSDDLPQYVYALTYHVIIFWFLSLKLEDRPGQVSWIAKNLISTDVNGKEKIDEQAQVVLDFMQRVTYADVDESAPDPTFNEKQFGKINKQRWIIGNSLVTVEQAARGGWGQITKRQPSGTSCYIIREKFNRPPPHQVPPPTDSARDGRNASEADENAVLPSHLLLQVAASIPQTADAVRPIPLPKDEAMDRFTRFFDRIFTVDSHKVGVIYIGENQTEETEILANVMGSSDYTRFLSGLGTLTTLKGAKFNTQGLDRETNRDGEYAFCWRDRVTEIVFHVTTQMPTNLEHDPRCIGKKQHIGNDFVNIIFNNSGHPFRFDTFPSQFNYVNIIITPESRASFVATRLRSDDHAQNAFYKVQVMSKPGFPEISPAAETKIMSLAALPTFIRLLALNASVFSLVWDNRHGGEHISSWRSRLREINKLREKYSQKLPVTTPTSPPGTAGGAGHEGKITRDSMTSLRRASVANFLTNNSEPSSQRSSMLSTAETEVGPSGGEGSLVDSVDFSRWATYKG